MIILSTARDWALKKFINTRRFRQIPGYPDFPATECDQKRAAWNGTEMSHQQQDPLVASNSN